MRTNLCAKKFAIMAGLILGCNSDAMHQSGVSPNLDSQEGLAESQVFESATTSCDPQEWSKHALEIFRKSEALNPPEAGPPPIDDATCEPRLDRSCSTPCDCKFALMGCGFTAVNKALPWNRWDFLARDCADGCIPVHCAWQDAPIEGTTLDCVLSLCVVRDQREHAIVYNPDLGDDGCDVDRWLKTLRTQWAGGVPENPKDAGPPPIDAETCKPILDRSCSTPCDCKFIRTPDGRIEAANKNVPWNDWEQGSDKCVPKDLETDCVEAKTLRCIQGECYSLSIGSVIPP